MIVQETGVCRLYVFMHHARAIFSPLRSGGDLHCGNCRILGSSFFQLFLGGKETKYEIGQNVLMKCLKLDIILLIMFYYICKIHLTFL